MTERHTPALWALIPAAGGGRRMGAERPKQFLRLGSRSVLEHTLGIFLEHPAIRGVVLVIGAGVDADAMELPSAGGRLFLVTGGAERADSVRNGLEFLAARARPEDWVLVHDAARPCLPTADLDRLISLLQDDAVGGLLAAPSSDTLKLEGTGERVERTLDRSIVWRALTPQMFRLQALRKALDAAAASGVTVTDEASAMELAGEHPRIVEGSSMNIKITRPEDLEVAEVYLRRQQRLRNAG